MGDLGEGSFGMVHKVQHKETGKFAAAKIIPVKVCRDPLLTTPSRHSRAPGQYEEELEDFVVEVDILAEAHHDSVVRLEGAYLHQDKLWVLLELCEGGALDDILLDLESGLKEQQIRCIAYQLLQVRV